MNLQSRISSYQIGVGEFLVVVPFVKKDNQNRHRVEASETPSNPSENIDTKLAESAWYDLMQDLSSMQDISNSGKSPKAELKPRNSENENASDKGTSTRTMKQKKTLNKGKEGGPSYDVLLSELQSSGDNMLDEQNLKKFIDFMDSLCCLTIPATGSCVMREANAILNSVLEPCKSSLCLCPPWLKDIMRAFCFINVYSACLQLWRKKITISALKGPLGKLKKLGFRPGIPDLMLLSQLCPQVIHLILKTMLQCHIARLSHNPGGFWSI